MASGGGERGEVWMDQGWMGGGMEEGGWRRGGVADEEEIGERSG